MGLFDIFSSKKYNLMTGYSSAIDSLISDPNVPVKEKLRLLYRKAENNANSERQNRATMQVDLYQGDQDKYLQALIKDPDRFSNYTEILRSRQFINITKLIIDKLSIIYQWGAKRQVVDENGKPLEEQQKLFDMLMESCNWNEVMTTANTYTNVCGNTVVRPFWVRGHEKLSMEVITPDKLSVLENPDDSTIMEAVVYRKTYPNEIFDTTTSDDDDVYFVWTNKYTWRFNPQQLTMYVMPENENSENVYGILPFVMTRNEMPMSGVWNLDGNDLIELQDQVNLITTMINYIQRFQGFAVPVFKNLPQSIFEAVKIISPSNPIRLPIGDRGMDFEPSVEVLEFGSKIQEYADECQRRLEMVVKSYGLSPNKVRDGSTAQSGYALKLEQQDIDIKWRLQHGYYENAEEQLFEVVKRIWNYHRNTIDFKQSDNPLKKYANIEFPENCRLDVTISEPYYPEDPTELRDRVNWEISKGYMSQYDYLIQVKGMTKEEAKRMIDENIEINEKYKTNPFQDEEMNSFDNDRPSNRPKLNDLKNEKDESKDEENE